MKIWQPTRQMKMHILIIDKVQVCYHTLLLPAFPKLTSDISIKPYAGITQITELLHPSQTFQNRSDKFSEKSYRVTVHLFHFIIINF